MAFTGALGAAKAAWTGAKAFGVGGLKGMAEAGIATGIWDAIAIPDLASRGEELGLADAIWDQAISAPIGFLLGGVGGVVGLRRARFVAEQERLIRERMAGADFGKPDSFFDLFMDESSPASTGRTVRDIQADWARQLRDAETAGGGRYDEKQIADTVGLVTAYFRSNAEINGIGTAEAMEAFGGFRSLAPDEVDAIVAGGGRRLDSPSITDVNDRRIEWRGDTHTVSLKEVVLETSQGVTRASGARDAAGLKNTRVETPYGLVVVDGAGIGELRASRTPEARATHAAVPELLEIAEWFRNEPNIERGVGHVRHAVAPVRFADTGRTYAAVITLKDTLDRNGNVYFKYYGHKLVEVEGAAPSAQASSAAGSLLPIVDAAPAWNMHEFLVRVKAAYEAKSGKRKSTRLPDDMDVLRGMAPFPATPDVQEGFGWRDAAPDPAAARADLFGRIAEQIAECVGRIA